MNRPMNRGPRDSACLMFFTLLTLLLGAHGTVVAKGAVPTFLSNELGVATLADMATALARPLDDAWDVLVEGGKKRQVKTCLDFLAVNKGKFELQNPGDWPVWWSQGAPCLALDALKAAKPASRSYLGWFRISKRAIANLPAGLAMADSSDEQDEVASAAKACRGWGQFDPSLNVRAKGPDRASLRSQGWTGSLVLYARTDIDGDGLEDLLIRRDAQVRGGTAAESEVFVVTQSSPEGCPRIVRSMGAPDTTGSP